MNKVLVSIIIVHFGSLKLVYACVNSILKFTININFEIIIVNNDITIQSFKSIQNLSESILIINTKRNIGFAAANNVGLEKSTGKYVLFLNNDTILFENTVRKIYDFAENIKGDYIIGCELLNKDRTHQNSIFLYPGPYYLFVTNLMLFRIFSNSKIFNPMKDVNKDIHKIKNVDSLMGAFLFSKIETIRELNGFDERFFFYHEETDLAFRLKKRGGSVIYFPNTKIIHLGGSNSSETNFFKLRQRFISIIQFLQKNVCSYKFIVSIILHYFGTLVRIPLFILGGIIFVNKPLFLRGLYNFKLLFYYPKNVFKN